MNDGQMFAHMTWSLKELSALLHFIYPHYICNTFNLYGIYLNNVQIATVLQNATLHTTMDVMEWRLKQV